MKGNEIEVATERGNLFRVTEDNLAECRWCGAPIIWCITVKGKKMSVDVPVIEGEPTTAHFATCPEGARWRKP
jgi:hypothetical protein